jgi:hypothetical protein
LKNKVATLAQLVERLIRNFSIKTYAINSSIGLTSRWFAYSARQALIEPDFEPNFAISRSYFFLIRIRAVEPLWFPNENGVSTRTFPELAIWYLKPRD